MESLARSLLVCALCGSVWALSRRNRTLAWLACRRAVRRLFGPPPRKVVQDDDDEEGVPLKED